MTRSRRWPTPSLLLWPQAAVVPFVNVAFVLAGFVLLSSTLVTPTGIPVQLPGAVTAETIGKTAVVLTVTDRDLVYLNDQLTTVEALPEQLAPLVTHGGPVVIRADHTVSMNRLTQLWDICRQAGASRIALATTRPPETP